jgi:hypothetical protein
VTSGSSFARLVTIAIRLLFTFTSTNSPPESA